MVYKSFCVHELPQLFIINWANIMKILLGLVLVFMVVGSSELKTLKSFHPFLTKRPYEDNPLAKVYVTQLIFRSISSFTSVYPSASVFRLLPSIQKLASTPVVVSLNVTIWEGKYAFWVTSRSLKVHRGGGNWGSLSCSNSKFIESKNFANESC